MNERLRTAAERTAVVQAMGRRIRFQNTADRPAGKMIRSTIGTRGQKRRSFQSTQYSQSPMVTAITNVVAPAMANTIAVSRKMSTRVSIRVANERTAEFFAFGSLTCRAPMAN